VSFCRRVGFSSPPGLAEAFPRSEYRRTISSDPARSWLTPLNGRDDEYTSVGWIGRWLRSAAAAWARTVRRLGRKFIGVTCHEDVDDWLQPDWVYRPAVNHFWPGGFLQRRRRSNSHPPGAAGGGVGIIPASSLFEHRGCRRSRRRSCTWKEGRCFSAWIHGLVKYGGRRREHRTARCRIIRCGNRHGGVVVLRRSVLGRWVSGPTSTHEHPPSSPPGRRSKDCG